MASLSFPVTSSGSPVPKAARIERFQMMKTLVRFWLYAGGLSLAFAAGALSQELPQPEVPNNRVSPVLSPTADDPILSMHLGYAGTFNSTVANGEFGSSIEGGIAHQWVFHRGAFNINGGGSQYFYAQAPEQNRFTFDVGASGSYQISRRAQFVISDRISSGFAREASSITEAQLAFPNAIVTSNGLSAGYAYELSRRTRFLVSTEYDNLLFDSSQPNIPSPNVVDEALLHGGATFSFRSSISHLVSKADSLGVAQQYSRSLTGAERSTTNSLHGTWQRPLSTNYNLFAEGGVDVFVTEQLSGLNFAPTGSLTVSRKIKRAGSLAVGVERHVEVIGATHISTSINVDGSVKVGKRLSLSAEGRAVHNDFPADPAYNYSPLIVGGTLNYMLPANLFISAGYSYWQRRSASAPIQTTVNAALPQTTIYNNVTLSYAKSWR